MATPRTHYDVLNVSPEAEPVVIEAAYRALIKKYHPDQAEGGAVPKDVAAINEAYGVLKEPARRADYDHRLWTRQQALRLAGLPPPPPRLSVWGGWLVAGLLACAVGAMALGRSLVALPAATAGDSGPAGAAEPPAGKAAAAEGAGLFPSPATTVRVEPRPTRRAVPARAPVRAVASVPRPRKARARPPAEGETRREDEFLERQGYIY